MLLLTGMGERGSLLLRGVSKGIDLIIVLAVADALAVAIDQGAGRIIDVATLTGACVVALGK